MTTNSIMRSRVFKKGKETTPEYYYLGSQKKKELSLSLSLSFSLSRSHHLSHFPRTRPPRSRRTTSFCRKRTAHSRSSAGACSLFSFLVVKRKACTPSLSIGVFPLSLSLSFCEEKRRAESDARGEEEEEEEEEVDAKTTEEKRWRERCGC